MLKKLIGWLKGVKCFFNHPFERNGRFVGRKKLFCKVYKLDVQKGITAYELGKILQTAAGEAYPYWVESLPKEIRRQFKVMSKNEFDEHFNPEMEIDQEA